MAVPEPHEQESPLHSILPSLSSFHSDAVQVCCLPEAQGQTLESVQREDQVFLKSIPNPTYNYSREKAGTHIILVSSKTWNV